MKKIALIFGITGQDGAYLTKFLLKKNYIVHGIKRRSSLINTQRLDDIYYDSQFKGRFFLHYGDLTDYLAIFQNIKKIKPDEIYNLGAQSHVKVSFEVPEYTANVDALGTLRILETIKTLNLKKKIKFYQAGTSEMFGSSPPPQNEKTEFKPSSPYAVAKLYAHWITKNYRNAYSIFASNGILFNHESPLRGETFVTKKIVQGMCNIIKGDPKKIFLGNLYAKRDWGHAEDYVEAMWKILQYKRPDDFVIASGKQISVKEFINKTAQYLNLRLTWSGKGENEIGLLNGKKLIFVDKRYFRPIEVNSLLGNSKYAQKVLNWKPRRNVDDLIRDMVDHEMK